MNNMAGHFYNTANMNYTYPDWNRYLGYNNAVFGQMSSCHCKKSFLRVLNTYNSALDIQVNDIIMAENLKSGKFTRYAKLSPGTYEVKIYESGEPKKFVFKSTIVIDQNLAYTGVVAEDERDNKDMCVLMIPEAKENTFKNNMSAIRLTNLVKELQDLELVASDGTILFSGIKYSDVSSNVAVPSGTYSLTLRDKKSKKSIKTLNTHFAPQMHYTLFVSGNHGCNSDVEVIIPEDGVNYLELC